MKPKILSLASAAASITMLVGSAVAATSAHAAAQGDDLTITPKSVKPGSSVQVKGTCPVGTTYYTITADGVLQNAYGTGTAVDQSTAVLPAASAGSHTVEAQCVSSSFSFPPNPKVLKTLKGSLTVEAPSAPATVTVDPKSVEAGKDVKLGWECTDPRARRVILNTGGAVPLVDGTFKDPTKGTVTEKVPDTVKAGTYPVKVTCVNDSAVPVQEGTAELTVTAPPAPPAAAKLTLDPKSVEAGNDVKLDWDCTNPAATYATFTTGGAMPGVENMLFMNEATTTAKVADNTMPATYPVTVVCKNDAGDIVQTGKADLTVEAPTPPPTPAVGKVLANNLSIRDDATTKSTKLSTLSRGKIVGLECKVRGQNVSGNNLWYMLGDGSGWVSARYVKNIGKVDWCFEPQPQPQPHPKPHHHGHGSPHGHGHR